MAERTFKQIAAGQRRSLRAIARKLRKLGDEWDDLDHVNLEMLYQLADKVEDSGDELYTGEAE